jgi:hypothetical protein
MGVEHVLRPFELERVTLPALRDPILSGLTVRDVTLESAEQIFPWAGDKYLVDDELLVLGLKRPALAVFATDVLIQFRQVGAAHVCTIPLDFLAEPGQHGQIADQQGLEVGSRDIGEVGAWRIASLLDGP